MGERVDFGKGCNSDRCVSARNLAKETNVKNEPSKDNKGDGTAKLAVGAYIPEAFMPAINDPANTVKGEKATSKKPGKKEHSRHKHKSTAGHDRSEARPAIIAADQKVNPGSHVIEKGESLWKLGKRMGMTDQEVANWIPSVVKANSNIKDPDKIFAGDEIILPGKDGAVPEQKTAAAK